jgi:hypothetical protein
VSNQFKYVSGFGQTVLLLLLFSGIGWGDQQSATGTDTKSLSAPAEEVGVVTVVPEDLLPPRGVTETHLVGDALAGYRFFTIAGNSGRAAEYEYTHSNPALAGLINYLGLENKFVLEGSFLNDRDYHADLTHDYKGNYRFNLRTESLFHNLDHESLFTPDFSIGAVYSAIDLNPGDRYGVRVEQDLARFRYKLDNFPLHVNLGYWRLVREGNAQQRFADQAFEGTPNSIFSRSRRIDRETHEGQIGFDAHLGPLDVIYDFRIRQFGDLAGTPRDPFIDRLAPDLAMPRNGGVQEHNENPDSRFLAHTIKLHTSLSGGIVGAASYTLGRRENLSTLSDIKGADQTHDTLHNVAGDFTFTPCGFFSAALKYRRQEVDRTAPANLVSAFAVNPLVGVRPAIDTQKDTIMATLSYRPLALLTVQGEYKGVFLSRDNIDAWNRPGRSSTLALPGHSATHSGTIALLSKPLKGLRLKTQYSYSTADNADYGTAFETRHEGSFFASYNVSNRWGATAHTRVIRENSDHSTITTLDLVSAPVTVRLPRERKVADSTVSLWFVPLQKLTITGSYGLLWNKSDQAVLFAGLLPGSDALTNFTSQAQIFSVNSLYRFNELLDLSLALQQVRSFAEFDPTIIDLGQNGNTAGIKEISQSRTVESSLSARAEFHPAKNYSCALDYSYKKYDEEIQRLSNGTVQTVMAYVSRKW